MLRTHLSSWIKLSKVETFEELIDLIAMEHFINKCPPYVKYWLQDKGPQTKIEATALLAEEYVIRRKTNQAEASKLSGVKPKEANSASTTSKSQGNNPKENNGS